MKIIDSEINIIFCLEGKNIELSEISDRLGIIPSKIRTPDDWPEAIKNPKVELPDYLKPRYTWDLELGYKKGNLVEERFDEMLDILRGKENIINELKKKFKLNIVFVVGIHAQHDSCNMPDIFLTQDIISFVASIGANITFDMYLD